MSEDAYALRRCRPVAIGHRGPHDNSRQLRCALLASRDMALRRMRREPAKAIVIAASTRTVMMGLAALPAYLRQRS